MTPTLTASAQGGKPPKWALYHDFDELKCEVIRAAIKAHAITDGEVICGDIKHLAANDVRGFKRCHFFAGGGFWDLALNLAGWGDEPVWTGSCPCQPFSAAGKQLKHHDPRHLWPEWIRLIRECRPQTIIGEQVGAAAGGKTYSQEIMQSLRGREAVRRVLYELERTAPRDMQILHAGSRETPETRSQAGTRGEAPPMAENSAGIRSGQCGPVQGQDEGTPMHVGRGEYSIEDRPWVLRGDGHAFRPNHSALMERTLFGSDFDGGGVHAGEHPRSDLRLECDGERLGHREGGGSRQRSVRETYRAEQRTARILRKSLEEAPDWSWFDAVRADLERSGYSCGTTVFGAHSVGAPHIRQRLYFCADTGLPPRHAEQQHEPWQGLRREPTTPNNAGVGSCISTGVCADSEAAERRWACPPHHRGRRTEKVGGPGTAGHSSDSTQRGQPMRWRSQGNSGYATLADEAKCGSDTNSDRLGSVSGGELHHQEHHPESCGISGVDLDAVRAGLQGLPGDVRDWRGPGWLDPQQARSIAETGATRGFWADCDWWYGRDGKYRPIGPGLQPLAHGSPARVGRLRLYGDAIVVSQAQAFIEAYRESCGI